MATTDPTKDSRSARPRTYWDVIEATYHPPQWHHPGTCPGCTLESAKWTTPVVKVSP
jgi:hypothetical protein